MSSYIIRRILLGLLTLVLITALGFLASAGYAATGRIQPLRRGLPDGRRAVVGASDETSETVFLAEPLADGPLHPGDLLLLENDAPYAIERMTGSPVDDLLEPMT